jgi:hypothetical protein
VLEVSLRGPCGSGGMRVSERAVAAAGGAAAACGRAGGLAAGRSVYAAGAVGADVG